MKTYKHEQNVNGVFKKNVVIIALLYIFANVNFRVL